MKKAVMVTLLATFSIAIVLFGITVSTNIFQSDGEVATSTVEPQKSVANEPKVESKTVNEATVAPSSGTPETNTCGVKNGQCSTAEIAKRNTQSDCWAIYKGSYYDITSYVNEHSGGSAVFNTSTCGQDMQAYLEGQASSAGRQARHSSSAYRDLEKLKIGSVVN